MALKLSVVIPTYRRPDLIQKCLRSFAAAKAPLNMQVEIAVVDNNSKDNTEATINEWQSKCPFPLIYVHEPIPGSSAARNAGIRATTGDLVGTIDDDEEIDPIWLLEVERIFADTILEFASGPCIPNWERSPPQWIPRNAYTSVIGMVVPSTTEQEMDLSFPGIATGGNSVYRRKALLDAGCYDASLGRFGAKLTGGEDEALYWRLLENKARGRYFPDLKIHHWVPVERMSKAYYRRYVWDWASTWPGDDDKFTGPRIAGLPRWRFGAAVRGGLKAFSWMLMRRVTEEEAFTGELLMIDLTSRLWHHKSKAI